MGALGGLIVSLLTGQLPKLIEAVWPDLLKLFGLYHDGRITETELKAKTQQALIGAVAQVDTAGFSALAETTKAFFGAMRGNPILQTGWIVTVLDQLFVLTWYQMVVPIGTWQGWWGGKPFPSPGGTIDWAYALLAICLGAGPLVFPKGLKL